MDKLMDNANLWHLRNQIFEDLSHEDVLNCRRVRKYWNESLRRLLDVKFIQDFGERYVEWTNKKVLTIIPGWKKAAQKYGLQATIEDLEEVKDSLKKLARGKFKCRPYPVPNAASNGDVKLMEFILKTSYDMNTKEYDGQTAWHYACKFGRSETAQVIIQNAKELGIDLNAKNIYGRTALHLACSNGQTETAQMILKNWKEFGIDIKAQDNEGKTVLDLINEESDEDYYEYLYDEIKKMLEKEYSQIDVTESVQSLNLD